MRHRQRLRKLVPEPPPPTNYQPFHTESLLLVCSCLKILWGARYGDDTLHIELPPLMTATRAPFEVTLTRDPVRIKYLQPLMLYHLDILYSSSNCIICLSVSFVRQKCLFLKIWIFVDISSSLNYICGLFYRFTL